MSRVLGIILLSRHGDRQGFYQDPDTYTPTNTHITPLGNQQEYLLGQLLRRIYLDPASPEYIFHIDGVVANDKQIRVRADAGGEGSVVLNSAAAMLQGLFPPTTQYNVTLSNGTTVVGPLGGYQTIPIESVGPKNDISLEGFVSCNAFTSNIEDFFQSSGFAAKAQENSAFFEDLLPYLDGRPANMRNMWNVFDYMNVQTIHNATYAAGLPPTYLARARDLANWLQYHIFSSPQADGIGNIAGRTILPSILNGIADIVDPANPLKLVYQAISYKPFISLFNMTGTAAANPELAGIVNYAAALALEVRQSRGGDAPVLRLKFKNGTEDAGFKTYNFLAHTEDVPLSTFVTQLSPITVNDTATWCSACHNTNELGCAALTNARLDGVASVRQGISPVSAGFLGAGLALVVALATFAVLGFLGFLTLKSNRRKKYEEKLSDTGSQNSVVKTV